MNVLVTGGAGLIGMAVRDDLMARGHTVTAIDVTDFGRDDPELVKLGFDDREAIEALIVRNRIEAIVHCGAISGPMLAKGDPLLIVRVNIDATALLLDLARVHKMKRFIFCSSISVYGNVGPGLITEATPLRPTSVYGASKVACEQLIEGFAAEYGVDGVSLRIGRVYGPYRRANCHLGTLIRNAETGRPTEIPCETDFIYHYVYVDDVTGAIAAVLEAAGLPKRAYNVGSGEALTMPEIARIAQDALPGGRISLVPGADDVPDIQTAFDVSLLETDLGWRPAYPMSLGLVAYRDAIRAGRAAP